MSFDVLSVLLGRPSGSSGCLKELEHLMVKSNRGAFPPPAVAQPPCVWEHRASPSEQKCGLWYAEDDFQSATDFH